MRYVVEVTGCDAVASLTLLDGEATVKELPGASHHMEGALSSADIDWRRGIAAHPSLSARATCTDGRSGRSDAQPVQFLPVKEVTPPEKGAAFPEQFVADGSGSTASFVGCFLGTRTLVRMSAAGKTLAKINTVPFVCSAAGYVTPRNAVSGKRWLVEPGVGACAFDDTLRITANTSMSVDAMAVGLDGDALVWDSHSPFDSLKRISHVDGAIRWSGVPKGRLISNPVVDSAGMAVLPIYIDVMGQYRGYLSIERRDWATGWGWSPVDQAILTYGAGDPAPIPPAALNNGGSRFYFASTTAPGTTAIYGCNTSLPNCQGWTSAPLGAQVTFLMAFGGDTRVAAVASQKTWFLDASTGAVLNPGSRPITPDGALVTLAVQQAKGAGQDFYWLNGSSQANALPGEIVAVDAPQSGELFRFQLASGSLTVAIDDAGEPWLRVADNLVRLLPLASYRALRGP